MSTRSRTGRVALALAAALLGVLALIGVVIVVTIGTLGSGQGCGSQASVGPAAIALGPPGSGQLVGASEYGGPGDPSSGTVGSSGANLLAEPDSYAELGGTTFATAAAMGGLPYMTPLRVTWGSHSAIAYKRDIGLGGGPIDGLPRVIDLWWQLAGGLGIPYEDGLWSGPVKVERPPASGAANLLGGDPLAAAAPQPTAATAPAPAAALSVTDGACAAPTAGGVALTPGPRAQLLNDGQASAPADAPAAVKGMIAAGNQIVGKPYNYGGGHGIPLDEIASNYDCSSSVAHLLYGGGLLPVSADVDSTELESFGDPGPGRWVTIYASAGHVFMYVAGLRWDTHNAAGPGDGSTGIGWHPLVRSDAGFVARHPSGALMGGRAMIGLTALIAASLAGCAAFSAPATTTAGRSPANVAVATAERTHEYPSPAPPAEDAAGSASAQAAVYAFAHGYINWDAGNVVADLTRLSRESVGQARSAMQIEAAGVAADYELRGGGIANAGTVEAIAPLRGRSDAFVVVTRESTSASSSDAYQGLRPAWHVTVATVRRAGPGDWVLSGWQPES